MGLKLPEGASVFYGLRYSLPPVGEHRWRKPRAWEEPLGGGEQGYFDASHIHESCPQICSLPSPQYTCPELVSFLLDINKSKVNRILKENTKLS